LAIFDFSGYLVVSALSLPLMWRQLGNPPQIGPVVVLD